jgi:hypothetical protein
MSSEGFKPAISAIERPQAYALDSAATGIGTSSFFEHNFITQLKLCWRAEKIGDAFYESHWVATQRTKIALLTCVRDVTYQSLCPLFRCFF